MTTRRDFLITTSAALAISATPSILRGHSITTFTRVRRNPELPGGIERLIGDRDGQLDALKGKTWDIVIDDSATNPDWVRQSTELLSGNVGRHMFTSSRGVYYPYLKRVYDENDAPHLKWPIRRTAQRALA